MKYDFDSFINRRNTGSYKWSDIDNLKIDAPDIIPYSIAEMEFRVAPAITNAIKEIADIGIYGYMGSKADYFDAVSSWMKRRHGWDVEPKWLVKTYGCVSAIIIAINAFTKKGDGIIIQPPVYNPFFSTIKSNGRKLVTNPLKIEGNQYIMDFDDLRKKAADPNNKMLILSNPHNPVGRVWKKEELEELGHICNENNVLVISDEIHFDIVFKPHKHTVYATLGEEFKQNCAVLTAPSKSFNLAGMHLSNIFIPNSELREKFIKVFESQMAVYHTPLGTEACKAAYRGGEDWFDQALEYIAENKKLCEEYLHENFPSVKMFELQGTYLLWVDFHSFGMDKNQLEYFMRNEAKLFLDEGYVFGVEGEGYERINIACPRSLLLSGLERLKEAAIRCGIKR